MLMRIFPELVEYPPISLPAIVSAHGEANGVQSRSWCELGCGTGLGAVINAAVYPRDRFIIIDPDAGRIGRGRRLAEAAGVNNVIFIRAEFENLAQGTCMRGPLHDFLIVQKGRMPDSGAARRAVQRCVRRWLKPGGQMLDASKVSPCTDDTPLPVDSLAMERCRTLNGIIAEHALRGEPYAFLAAPGLGAPLPADPLQMAAMLVLQRCPDVEGQLMEEMVQILLSGFEISMDEDAMRRLECFERLVLPRWKRLGMLPEHRDALRG
ncbi:class I SAM-dependent methyltransferase [Stutzerimonas tarimensis]|uniref:Class I SAM-dependent methyltransferase n=1 Tax=Stutzerimonas tarimensis TaxID=1507735 RepID=A0ABV7T568_9GAMM